MSNDGSGGTARPTIAMQQLINLIRRKLHRKEDAVQSPNGTLSICRSTVLLTAGATQTPTTGGGLRSWSQKKSPLLQASPEFELTMSHSTLRLGTCWLCGDQPASPFVALAADELDDSRSSAAATAHTRAARAAASELCTDCFRLGYRAVVRPVLARDARLGELAARLEAATVAEAASPERLAGTVLRTTTWSCPRCTYSNPEANTSCGVCACVAPHVTTCTLCNTRLTSATLGTKCSASGHTHQVWECSDCTVMNTVNVDTCGTCSAAREWPCPRCSVPNRSRKNPYGERSCFACGYISLDMTASTAIRMGLDPADMEREAKQAAELREHEKRLDKRLAGLGLKRKPQTGDGNCQFRAIADQLFGTPDLHMLVRHVVTEHMLLHADDFGIFFETPEEFVRYVEGMKISGAWGDEMALRAAADAFGAHVHVVTSAAERWHLHFAPDVDKACGPVDDGAPLQRLVPHRVSAAKVTPQTTADPVAASLATTSVESAVSTGSVGASADVVAPHLFLAYTSPVHYDGINVAVAVPNVCAALTDVLCTIEADENEWDDARPPEDPAADWIEINKGTNAGKAWTEQQQRSSSSVLSGGSRQNTEDVSGVRQSTSDSVMSAGGATAPPVSRNSTQVMTSGDFVVDAPPKRVQPRVAEGHKLPTAPPASHGAPKAPPPPANGGHAPPPQHQQPPPQQAASSSSSSKPRVVVRMH